MNSFDASLLGDVAPGLTAVFAALLAAFFPYLIMYQSRRGRARSAIAYILGLFGGLAATALLTGTIGAQTPDNTSIISAGALASFFAPFAGMLRARWKRPPRRQPRGQAFAR